MLSAPEPDPVRNIKIVWCIRNVCEEMVMYISCVRKEILYIRIGNLNGLLRYKKNQECSETQYLMFGPSHHAFVSNISK